MEPGGTALGRRIRNLLKKQVDVAVSPEAELLLFNASRAQLVEEVILPALKEGLVVICDRFYDSSTAYQGFGRGLDINAVKSVNRFATKGLEPDLTILLDIPPADGLQRKSGGAEDRFERELTEFHRRVRRGYRRMAISEPGRWLVIDGRLLRKEIANRIWDKVKTKLEER
jgi:dTMP kinase